MQDAYELREEAKALQKQEDGMRGLVVGNTVYEALTFADPSTQKILKFTTRQYRFLNAFRLGITVQEAALKAGMECDSAERFLKKPDTIAWLQDRALKDHIKKEWEEPGKIYAEANRLYYEEKVPKHRVEILKEFWDRVVPKQSRNAEVQNGSITININPQAIERSKERRATIDAEIVKPS